MNKHILGRRILAAREAAGLSLAAAARTAGVRYETWRAWERGDGAPQAMRLAEVARVVGVDLATLLRDDPSSSAP